MSPPVNSLERYSFHQDIRLNLNVKASARMLKDLICDDCRWCPDGLCDCIDDDDDIKKNFDFASDEEALRYIRDNDCNEVIEPSLLYKLLALNGRPDKWSEPQVFAYDEGNGAQVCFTVKVGSSNHHCTYFMDGMVS